MKLTQKQEWMIARRLREVDQALGDVSDRVRRRVHARAENQIQTEMRQRFGTRAIPPTDAEIAALLEDLAQATAVTEEVVEEAEAPPALAEERPQRWLPTVQPPRWLGVCSGLAQFLGLRAWMLRAPMFLLGLLTGPLAVTLYLGLYFALYLLTREDSAPPIDWPRIPKRVLALVLIAAAMDAGARAVQWGAAEAYRRFLAQNGPPPSSTWNWLQSHETLYLAAVVAFLLPFAVLSALPLANDWDQSIQRVTNAGLALYALFLSAGAASFVTGLILEAVKGMGPL